MFPTFPYNMLPQICRRMSDDYKQKIMRVDDTTDKYLLI